MSARRIRKLDEQAAGLGTEEGHAIRVLLHEARRADSEKAEELVRQAETRLRAALRGYA